MFLDAVAAVEAGPHHDRLRHHRSHPAHVLPLPGSDPPRERGQGHGAVEGRDRAACTSGRTPCSARSGTWSTTRTPRLMVISDHGFTNFRRCVNINSWLRENGYLFLKDESAHRERRVLRRHRLVAHQGLRAGAHRTLHQPQGAREERHRRGGQRVPRAGAGARREARTPGGSADGRRLRASRRGVAAVLPAAPTASTRRTC